MGCLCRPELNSEKLLEILVEKRRDLIMQRKETINELSLFDKEAKKLQESFFKDINDESALVEYLDTLYKLNYKEKFDYELMLYFDVLSVKNRIKYTGFKRFTASIEIFLKVIGLLCDKKFEEIKELDAYKDKYDICGREVLITFKDFSFKRKLKGKKGDERYLNSKNVYLKKFLKLKKLQKITINNPELYFNSLIQLYFETIEKADNNQMQYIQNIMEKLKKLKNSHIIKYPTYFFENNNLYIIMEFMNNSDIFGYIQGHQILNKSIPEDEIWNILLQCLSALDYLHKQNAGKYGIKLTNIFMNNEQNAKIGVFRDIINNNENFNLREDIYLLGKFFYIMMNSKKINSAEIKKPDFIEKLDYETVEIMNILKN